VTPILKKLGKHHQKMLFFKYFIRFLLVRRTLAFPKIVKKSLKTEDIFTLLVPRRLFFAAPQRIAITLGPNYYKKMQRSTTRKNQEEHGPDVM
jgi:hypothetical protein